MIETVVLIAIGWFGHKYKDPIVKKVKDMVGSGPEGILASSLSVTHPIGIEAIA